MNRRGFSLVELVVIMGIIGILLGIGTLNFRSMSRKGSVEAQTKMMHADLMTARAQALFLKRGNATVISGSTWSSYSSLVTSVSPVRTKTMKFALASPAQVNFDQNGMSNYSTAGAICISASSTEDSAVYDSIVVRSTMLYMGKLQKGAACSSENIAIK